MCAHDKPVAANKATVSCKIYIVSLLQDFTGLSGETPINQVFEPIDFDCVTDGKVDQVKNDCSVRPIEKRKTT